MGQSSLGDLLRTKRKELGITQKTLSEKSGISLPMISYMENGRKAGRQTLLKISKALDIDFLYLKDINTQQRLDI